MSGPKSVAYQVTHNPALARRALMEAWSAAERAESMFAAQLNDVDAAMRLHADEELVVEAVRPARPATGAAFEAVVAYTNALNIARQEIAARLQSEIARAERARYARRLAQAEQAQRTVTARLRAATAGAGTSRPPEFDFDVPEARVDAGQAASFSTRVDDLVARLPTMVADDQRSALLHQAHEVLAASGTVRAELLFRDLRQAIRRARRDAESRLQETAAAEDLLLQSCGLEGSQVTEIRARLESVVNEGARISRDELSQACEVVERARLEADRSYAAQSVVAALGQLGYVVDEEFSTLTVESGVAYFTSPRWRDHRLRLLLHDEGKLNLNVVRIGDAALSVSRDQQRTDTLVEKAWCESAEGLPDALAERGVRAEIVGRRAPGELPVQVIQSQATAKRAQGIKAAQGAARVRYRDG